MPQQDSAARPDQAKITEAITKGDKALSRGDLELALFEYVKALERDQDNVEVLYKIAAIHGIQGKTALAEKTFREALAQDENHPGVLEGLGLVLLRKNEPDEASAYLQRAVATDPARWRAHNALGIIDDLNNEHLSAAQHYQTALKQRPDLPMLLNNLGYSKYLAGELEAAQGYYEQALAGEPEHRKAWSNLGLLYTRQGKYDKAIEAFERSMDKPQALNNVGYICMLSGELEQAEKFFLRAIKRSPTYYLTAYQNLKRVRDLSSQARGDEDDVALEKAVPDPGSPAPATE